MRRAHSGDCRITLFFQELSLYPVFCIGKSVADQFAFNPEIIEKMAEPERHFGLCPAFVKTLLNPFLVLFSETDFAEKKVFDQITDAKRKKVEKQL